MWTRVCGCHAQAYVEIFKPCLVGIGETVDKVGQEPPCVTRRPLSLSPLDSEGRRRFCGQGVTRRAVQGHGGRATLDVAVWTPAGGKPAARDKAMDLEFHQLDVRYEHLRLRRPDRERRLFASLAEKGQQVPIVVVALFEDPGRYQVIDGHKRVRLLRRLGADTVQATVWDLSEAEALLLDRSLRTAEAETAIEQGWLL